MATSKKFNSKSSNLSEKLKQVPPIPGLPKSDPMYATRLKALAKYKKAEPELYKAIMSWN